jgi:hypothetical protein
MFSEGTVSGAADTSVFRFCPRIKEVKGNYPLQLLSFKKFSKVIASGAMYAASLMYPQDCLRLLERTDLLQPFTFWE